MRHPIFSKSHLVFWWFIVFAITSALNTFVTAQSQLLTFDNETGEVDIPFEYVNSFMVITLEFNNVPLKFIFDTGAQNTILTHKEVTDFLNVNYRREITILGSDMETELQAYIATGITMELGEELKARDQAILVLADDYFHFEEYTGVSIQGILGADFLRRFVIHINYRQRRIRFQDPNRFRGPRRDYVKLNAEFFRYRPFITIPGNINPDQIRDLKLLVDTGAGLPMLIHTNLDSTLLLPSYTIKTEIGRGLGGYIYGFLGRSTWIEINGHRLEQVITHFQDIPIRQLANPVHLNQRHGILGNQVLERFDIQIDYVREAIYVKPNRSFRKSFRYDRSGMSLAASGTNLSTFSVLTIVEGSPADEAGLMVGDVIRIVNGVPAVLLSLDSIIRTLQKKSGKRIRLLVKRGEERYSCEFFLRDLI